jgi:hypothetical protein
LLDALDDETDICEGVGEVEGDGDGETAVNK